MSVVLACSVVLAGGSCGPHHPGFVQWVADPGGVLEPVWMEKGCQCFSRAVGCLFLASHPFHP